MLCAERWVGMEADQEMELSAWTTRRAQTFSAFPFILCSRVHRAHTLAHEGEDTLAQYAAFKGDQWELFLFSIKEQMLSCMHVLRFWCLLKLPNNYTI